MKFRRGWICFFVLFTCLALDIFTKYWIHHSLFDFSGVIHKYPYGGIGLFHDCLGIDCCINRVYNTGGAWGMFSDYPRILLSIRCVIISLLSVYVWTTASLTFFRRCALSIICIGAIGNVIDYFIYGAVVDMIHCVFWGYSYPVFNVADTLIVGGVAALCIQWVIHYGAYRKKSLCK